MQVFKVFMKILKNHMRLAMIWVITFLIISIAAVNSSSQTQSFSSQKLDICLFDKDNSSQSQKFAQYLSKKHNLVSINENEDEILDALYYESADYAIVINPNFGKKLSAGETQGLFSAYHVHDSYSTTLAENDINEYINTVCSYCAGGSSLEQAMEKAENTLAKQISVSYETFGEDENTYDDFYFYFQYLPYIFLSVMVVALAPVLIKLNGKQISMRMKCSCLTARSQTAQTILASIVFVLGVWLIFIVAGMLINGQVYRGNMWYAVLNSFVFVLISAAISLLVSAFSPSNTAVNVISNIIGLGMSFFCGIFVSQSLLGDQVLKAARFLPAYWYIKINDMLSGNSSEVFSLNTYFKYLSIEILFAIVIFTACAVIFKYKHDKSV